MGTYNQVRPSYNIRTTTVSGMQQNNIQHIPSLNVTE